MFLNYSEKKEEDEKKDDDEKKKDGEETEDGEADSEEDHWANAEEGPEPRHQKNQSPRTNNVVNFTDWYLVVAGYKCHNYICNMLYKIAPNSSAHWYAHAQWKARHGHLKYN